MRQRKKIRLVGYDYSTNGAYFITACTKNRELLFGEIVGDVMIKNKFGQIVCDEINKTNKLRRKENISISKFIVMPNHIHLIIAIRDGAPRHAIPNRIRAEQFSGPIKQSVSSVVRSLKSAITKRIHENVKETSQPERYLCHYEIWQSRFYDHIIRNDSDYKRIWSYIDTNPTKWENDCFFMKPDKRNKI